MIIKEYDDRYFTTEYDYDTDSYFDRHKSLTCTAEVVIYIYMDEYLKELDDKYESGIISKDEYYEEFDNIFDSITDVLNSKLGDELERIDITDVDFEGNRCIAVEADTEGSYTANNNNDIVDRFFSIENEDIEQILVDNLPTIGNYIEKVEVDIDNIEYN